MNALPLDRSGSPRGRGAVVARGLAIALALVLAIALIELSCVAHDEPGPAPEAPAALPAQTVVTDPPSTWELDVAEAAPSALGLAVTR